MPIKGTKKTSAHIESTTVPVNVDIYKEQDSKKMSVSIFDTEARVSLRITVNDSPYLQSTAGEKDSVNFKQDGISYHAQMLKHNWVNSLDSEEDIKPAIEYVDHNYLTPDILDRLEFMEKQEQISDEEIMRLPSNARNIEIAESIKNLLDRSPESFQRFNPVSRVVNNDESYRLSASKQTSQDSNIVNYLAYLENIAEVTDYDLRERYNCENPQQLGNFKFKYDKSNKEIICIEVNIDDKNSSTLDEIVTESIQLMDDKYLKRLSALDLNSKEEIKKEEIKKEEIKKGIGIVFV